MIEAATLCDGGCNPMCILQAAREAELHQTIAAMRLALTSKVS